MGFEIKLAPESKKKLDDLARASKIDLRPVLKVVGIGYRKEANMIFSRQQPRGEGARWPQLSPQYAARKERQYPGQPMLVRTGALLSSMISKGSPGNISLISKSGAVFGSSVSYGIYHDEGGQKIPRRNFSEPSERRKKIWIDQIERSLRHNFEKNGIDVQGSILQ